MWHTVCAQEVRQKYICRVGHSPGLCQKAPFGKFILETSPLANTDMNATHNSKWQEEDWFMLKLQSACLYTVRDVWGTLYLNACCCRWQLDIIFSLAIKSDMTGYDVFVSSCHNKNVSNKVRTYRMTLNDSCHEYSLRFMTGVMPWLSQCYVVLWTRIRVLPILKSNGQTTDGICFIKDN